MKLTPLDIKKQEFARVLRGYDVEEVQAYLDMMATQWEEMRTELRRAEERVSELNTKLEHYQRVEEALQEALQTARENSRKTIENAREEARLILDRARNKADGIKREALQVRDQLAREVEALSGRRNEVIARLRAFLLSEVELLSRFEGDGSGAANLLRASDAFREGTEMPDRPDTGDGGELAHGAVEKAVPARSSSGALDEPLFSEADSESTRAPGGVRPSFRREEAVSYRTSQPEPSEEVEPVVPPATDRRQPDQEEGFLSPAAIADGEDAGRKPDDRMWIVHPSGEAAEMEEEEFVTPTAPEAPDEGKATASAEELEKIRRILNDLD